MDDINLFIFNAITKDLLMKNILLFMLLCVCFCLHAQDHLTFRGIPIEGSMTDFCQKLKAKGFTQVGKDRNITLFNGDFTGRQATIGVGASDDSKNVFSVVVLFDPSGEWNNLISTYDYYKELYTRKYGEPKISKETNPSHSDSNTALMAEVHEGTVVYVSAWTVPGGNIQLSIEKSSGVYEGMVMIRYQDSQNVEAKIKRDLEEI